VIPHPPPRFWPTRPKPHQDDVLAPGDFKPAGGSLLTLAGGGRRGCSRSSQRATRLLLLRITG